MVRKTPKVSNESTPSKTTKPKMENKAEKKVRIIDTSSLDLIEKEEMSEKKQRRSKSATTSTPAKRKRTTPDRHTTASIKKSRSTASGRTIKKPHFYSEVEAPKEVKKTKSKKTSPSSEKKPSKTRSRSKSADKSTKKPAQTTKRSASAEKKPSSKRRKLVGTRRLTEEEKQAMRKVAEQTGGVPDPKKSDLPKKRLSPAEAFIKYEARLAMYSKEDFAFMDGCWISTYDTKLKSPAEFNPSSPSNFSHKWMDVLAKVANAKGVVILGYLSHASKTIEKTDLRAFDMKPECVEKGTEDKYKELGYDKVVGNRVYVGPKRGGMEASKFMMCPSDYANDAMWCALKIDVLEPSIKKEEPKPVPAEVKGDNMEVEAPLVEQPIPSDPPSESKKEGEDMQS